MAAKIKAERDINLIELVRAQPMLYDKNADGYKNNKKKTDVWEAIANDAGFSSIVIIHKK